MFIQEGVKSGPHPSPDFCLGLAAASPSEALDDSNPVLDYIFNRPQKVSLFIICREAPTPLCVWGVVLNLGHLVGGWLWLFRLLWGLLRGFLSRGSIRLNLRSRSHNHRFTLCRVCFLCGGCNGISSGFGLNLNGSRLFPYSFYCDPPLLLPSGGSGLFTLYILCNDPLPCLFLDNTKPRSRQLLVLD